MSGYNWQWKKEGRMAQVIFAKGEDIEHLAELDQKNWAAIAMPTTGVRFDERTLQLMDTDGDGRIRAPEVLAAVEWLKSRNVDLNTLFGPKEDDEKALLDNLSRQADLAALEPSAEEKKQLADWEYEGKSAEILVAGDDTPAADKALAAVEPLIDAFFVPPEDMPLVTEAPDVTIPLIGHINPKHQEAIFAFADKCVKPVLGDVTFLDRMGWKKVKAAFAPYRAWLAAKPVLNATKKDELVAEERTLRYKLHLADFLNNYVSMKDLYANGGRAIFQTGILRIDAKELTLCFHVANEGAHSALSGKSNCCVIYLKLTRPSEKAERSICAVVTAGTVGQLYAGRNGVFFDFDGKDWDATITKVVESQVSLAEAFWSPWRKLGEGIGNAVKKFLGERQTAAQSKVDASAQSAQAGGAALASSVAAIGIGVGMVGAAAASLMAAISQMSALQILVSVVALVFVVSLPSVILTWFKLRRRDLGAILNAGGWAINRPLYFSVARARAFTKCARNPLFLRMLIILAVVALGIGAAAWYFTCCNCAKDEAKCTAPAAVDATPVTENATEAK